MGRGRSRRAGSGREMRNANYFNSTMRYKTFKIKKPKYITLAFNVFSVTSETSEQTSKQKFALGLKNRLTSGEMVNPFTVVTSQAMKKVKRHKCMYAYKAVLS